MQKIVSLSLAALCCAALVAPAGAEQQPEATAAPPASPLDTIMKQDADGDGKISLAESFANESERFKEMDADGDGFVTGDEAGTAIEAQIPAETLEKMKARGMPEPNEIFLNRFDTNGDGKVDFEEFGRPSTESFKFVDTDGDGFLTKPELEGYIDHMKEQVKRMQQQQSQQSQEPQQ